MKGSFVDPEHSLPCSQKAPSPLDPVLNQMNSVCTLIPYSLRSILILSSHLDLGLPSNIFPSGSPTKFLYAFLISLLSFMHPYVISSFLSPNILLGALFSETLNLNLSLMRNHFSHPNEPCYVLSLSITTGRIDFVSGLSLSSLVHSVPKVSHLWFILFP
jgi:hypothetical protein